MGKGWKDDTDAIYNTTEVHTGFPRIRESVLAILVLCLNSVPLMVQSVLRFVIGVRMVTSRMQMFRGY